MNNIKMLYYDRTGGIETEILATSFLRWMSSYVTNNIKNAILWLELGVLKLKLKMILTRSLPRQISCARFMLSPIRFKFLAIRHGNFMAFHLLCQNLILHIRHDVPVLTIAIL